jgi:hypothetical protein
MVVITIKDQSPIYENDKLLLELKTAKYPTGPAPNTVTSSPGRTLAISAPKYPVGSMSLRNSTSSSDLMFSKLFWL